MNESLLEGAMNIQKCNLFAELSRAAYPDTLHRFVSWRPTHRPTTFAGNTFDGFVASDKDNVYLVFRGTSLSMRSLEALEASATQLLCNFDFAQVPYGTGRVHRGWNREVDRSI